MSDPSLHVQLDYALPPEIDVGAGTAVFVSGWCFCPEARIHALEFVLDGSPQAVSAARMPRLDPFRALHPSLDPFATSGLDADPDSAEDPWLLAYRTGFWGLVEIAPGPGPWRLDLRAELGRGEEAVAALGTMSAAPHVEPAGIPAPIKSAEPLIAVAMATYEPPADLLARQLDSIRRQTHRNWVCVISDDCSSATGQATLAEAVGDDPRFIVSRSPRRLGFYRNFERALKLVPPQADLVAMADQDDDWHAEKLAVLCSCLGDAQLVYSDARVVSRDGQLISDTWWNRRRNNHRDLLSLLVANAVTGAASLLRRDLLDSALPFPPAQFAHYHDHWVALCALAIGDIAYVDRPLYDYVQHGHASLGHEAANRMTGLRERIRQRRGRSGRERIRMWRLHYFVDFCRLLQVATILRLRCGQRMSRSKRRALASFLVCEQSLPGALRLALRGARELSGTPETLGAEWMLFHAVLWRRLVELSARERPQARLRLDALPPAQLVQHAARSPAPGPVSEIADKVAPLRWAVADDAPPRINLLIPTIDLQHFFGGYIGKFNLAQRLADRGHRVRLVTVDPVGPLPADWRARTEAFSGLNGLFDRVEVAFGREAESIEMSRQDLLIATTWWTAHIARDGLRFIDAERFLYLIQEYEPFTFPMGTYAALAEQSYRFPHVALFSSELLRDYFSAHRIGIYAEPDPSAFAFENAITDVTAPSAGALAGRRPRRLLFYARPEAHAARNMFELGMLALREALGDGLFRAGWELDGIGTVEGARSLPVGAGAELKLVPRSDQAAYGELLRNHDLGLALMYTPHPSLVPIEMAAAGMLAVTNSFENKTPDALRSISSNLIVAEPTVESIAQALHVAAAKVEDVELRVHGAAVRWARNWRESFSDSLLDQLLDALAPASLSISGADRGDRAP